MVNKRRHAHIPCAKKVLFVVGLQRTMFAFFPSHLEREHSNDEKKLILRVQEERDHLLNQQVN